MTLLWSKLFYKIAVMTLFRHNTQPKCATITLFLHMPLFRHQRVSQICKVQQNDYSISIDLVISRSQQAQYQQKVWCLNTRSTLCCTLPLYPACISPFTDVFLFWAFIGKTDVIVSISQVPLNCHLTHFQQYKQIRTNAIMLANLLCKQR